MTESIIKQLQSAVDSESLVTLQSLVGDGFVSLLQRFITDSEKHIKGINEACDKKEWGVLYELAHTLKGSSGTLSALRLSSHCQRLEDKILVSQSEEEVRQVIRDIETEFCQVKYILEETICAETD